MSNTGSSKTEEGRKVKKDGSTHKYCELHYLLGYRKLVTKSITKFESFTSFVSFKFIFNP